MELNTIIIKPIITERAMDAVGKGKFTFAVASFADKRAIKKAIEEAFRVTVVAVATRITKGRKKRVGSRRREVPIASIKKATVTLMPGQKIAVFETGS